MKRCLLPSITREKLIELLQETLCGNKDLVEAHGALVMDNVEVFATGDAITHLSFAVKIYRWLWTVAELQVGEGSSDKCAEVIATARGLDECVADLADQLSDDYPLMLWKAFRQEGTFYDEGAFMRSVTQCAFDKDVALLQPLKVAFTMPFGDAGASRLEMFSLESATSDTVHTLSQWNIPEELFMTATKQATRSGDTVLNFQISMVHHIYNFFSAASQLWQQRSELLGSAPKLSPPTPESIRLMKSLRTAFAAVTLCSCVPRRDPKQQHNEHFDKLFKTNEHMQQIIKNCNAEFQNVCAPFAEASG